MDAVGSVDITDDGEGYRENPDLFLAMVQKRTKMK